MLPIRSLLAALLLLVCSTGAHAQATEEGPGVVRYVDDVLTITMRTGRGTDFQIVRTLDSGASVQLLENDSEGYARVRLADGAEGWVLSRYLKAQPPARQRLAAAEQSATQAVSRSTELEQQLDSAQTENKALREQLGDLQRQQQAANTELTQLRTAINDASGAPARLQAMGARVEELSGESTRLLAMNAELRDQSRLNWFIVGAGVLLAGILLGLLLPRLKTRKRSSWGSM